MRHIANKLKIASCIRVDHHSPFYRRISNSQRSSRKPYIEAGLGVLEQRASRGERIVS